jgi:hypothetical protein
MLRSPRRAFERVPLTTGVLRPFAFAYVIQLIAVWIGTMWEVALRSVWMAYLPRVRDYEGSTAQIIGALTAPLWVPLVILISVVLQHVFLLIVGGARQGFGATLRALVYASAPSILAVVPLCGAVVGSLWSVVLGVIGLSTLHRITIGRALFAVLLPLVLCCACLALGVALFGSAIMGSIATRP